MCKTSWGVNMQVALHEELPATAVPVVLFIQFSQTEPTPRTTLWIPVAVV